MGNGKFKKKEGKNSNEKIVKRFQNVSVFTRVRTKMLVFFHPLLFVIAFSFLISIFRGARRAGKRKKKVIVLYFFFGFHIKFLLRILFYRLCNNWFYWFVCFLIFIYIFYVFIRNEKKKRKAENNFYNTKLRKEEEEKDINGERENKINKK